LKGKIMKDNTGLACVGLLVLTVVAVVLGAVMNGYVLSVLWGWFVVPLFSAPPLSVATAIGLSLAVGMLVSHESSSSSGKKDTSDAIAAVVSRVILAPLFTLFVGWIVKSFV
jgi:hypothetical protein